MDACVPQRGLKWKNNDEADWIGAIGNEVRARAGVGAGLLCYSLGKGPTVGKHTSGVITICKGREDLGLDGMYSAMALDGLGGQKRSIAGIGFACNAY